jgi:hypothetical protein
MTTTTTKGGAPGVYSYAPGVTAKPLRLRHKGKWIAFGAPITVTPEPPRLPYTVPEATQAELAELYEIPVYKAKLVFTPASTATNVPAVSKPNTGSAEGSKKD